VCQVYVSLYFNELRLPGGIAYRLNCKLQHTLVERVADDGPAMAAGIEPGDIIAATGGNPVVSMTDFYPKVWAQGESGHMISITVIKGTDVYELAIRSGDRYQWLHLQHTY
jgi:S1-C subfamily serine protease